MSQRYRRGFLKKIAKRVIHDAFLSRADGAIIVASIGRSGSTLLTHAVGDGIGRNSIPFYRERMRNVILREAWSLQHQRFQRGHLYKTHDFPEEAILPSFARVIFVYRDPFEIVRSVINCEKRFGLQWIREHFAHLKANFDEYEHILDKDCLGIEKQIRAWCRPQPFALLTIRYDKIWQHQGELERFLGFSLDLPQREETPFGRISVADENRLEATYRQVANNIYAMETVKTWSVSGP